jgi:hypothetical protein
MKQNIDILKAKVVEITSTLVSVCIRNPYPGSPTSEDAPY